MDLKTYYVATPTSKQMKQYTIVFNRAQCTSHEECMRIDP